MNTNKTTGFAGLMQYATEICHAIAEADKIAQQPPNISAKSSSEAQTVEPTHTEGKAKLLVIVISFLALIIIIIALASEDNSYSSRSTSYDNVADPSVNYEDELVSNNDTDNYEEAIDSDSDINSDMDIENSSDTQSNEYDYNTSPEAIDGSSRPDMSTDTLTMSEIKYCYAEVIRIGAEKEEIESFQYSDVERFNLNVDRFNQESDDLKVRCLDKYADKSLIESIKPEIDAQSAMLKNEGRARVR